MTPLIPVLDVDQTQTQLKIANVSDQTHIRHIDQGILPVQYDKATAESENIERCQILSPLIPVLDVNQNQVKKVKLILDISTKGYYQFDMTKPQLDLRNFEQCQILTPLIPVLDIDQTQTQLKIANVSDQTHIRHIDQGILPV